MLNPAQVLDPAALQEVERSTYSALAAQYGLTLEEAQPAIDAFKAQTETAAGVFRRAHQAAAMALAARLQQLGVNKRPLT